MEVRLTNISHVLILAFLVFMWPGTSLSNEKNMAFENLDKLTEELDRFHDSNVATSEGYVHYDGYDTFSMGEHWYNRDVYESGKCNRATPTHLQYLVIKGKRKLIGTGYICVPQAYVREKHQMFDKSIVWHTHGPAWCLLPNGATEDYRDIADSLPNKLTSRNWQSICKKQGGAPASQDVKMLHTWNWIPSPNGRFAHENFAIPFLRVGLPVPDMKFLDSNIGEKTISVLKLAHGDTQWWIWRGFDVIAASDLQRRKGWEILRQARSKGQSIQEELIEIGKLDDKKFIAKVESGQAILNAMHNQMGEVLTKDQMTILKHYLSSIQTHEHHEARTLVVKIM